MPRAAHDEIVEWRAGRLRVRVTAPPERGRANAALEALLAEALDIPRRRVRVVSGHTAPAKLVEIEGVDEMQLAELLGRAKIAAKAAPTIPQERPAPTIPKAKRCR